jgi:beta-galactosidase
MEHSTSAVNWQPRNIAKAPGELLRNSLQHVARGADGALFFQWRAAKAGAEKFHSALVPHAGPDTKVFAEVVELGRTLRAIREVVGSTVADAQVAILHDTDARWASELDSHPSVDVSTVGETRSWHGAFYGAGITTDFRQSSDDLSAYRLVVAPVQYLATDAGIANLTQYVCGGGQLVVTYFSGIVDENDHIRLGGYPGAFADLLGIRIEEFFPLHADQPVRLSQFGSGSIWSELGRSSTAEVLAEYSDGPVAGSPAVTRNRAGDGSAYYVGTSLSREGLAEFVALLAADTGLTPAVAGLEAGIEAVTRANGGDRWTFVINHSDASATVGVAGTDLITGETVRDTLTVAAGGVSVVRRL